MSQSVRVLFVCIGNICRSPTAEGVFRTQVEKAGWGKLFSADSAGTTAWHVGEPPDARTQKHAAARGYNLSQQRARQICAEDFERFDLILAMEKPVFDEVCALQKISNNNSADKPSKKTAKVEMFLSYLSAQKLSESGADINTHVPDPYYGGADGFDTVIDVVEAGSEALLRALLQQQGVLSCGC